MHFSWISDIIFHLIKLKFNKNSKVKLTVDSLLNNHKQTTMETSLLQMSCNLFVYLDSCSDYLGVVFNLVEFSKAATLSNINEARTR